jgi:hypothetical protein
VCLKSSLGAPGLLSTLPEAERSLPVEMDGLVPQAAQSTNSWRLVPRLSAASAMCCAAASHELWGSRRPVPSNFGVPTVPGPPHDSSMADAYDRCGTLGCNLKVGHCLRVPRNGAFS